MQRFFVPAQSIQSPKFQITDFELFHQITHVLRLKTKDQIILLDNSGQEFLGEIEVISKNLIRGKILQTKQNLAEPNLQITLWQALPNQMSKFEEILQHGTEVGVTAFVPIVSARSKLQSLRNLPRLTKILRESAEQSGRGKIPQLHDVLTFTQALSQAQNQKNFLADSFCAQPFLADLLPQIYSTNSLNLWVGPEGGFTPDEIQKAHQLNFQNFSLGVRILRTETAGVAIVSAIFFSQP